MLILPLIPLACFLLIFLTVSRWKRFSTDDWRETFLISALLCSLALVLMTEILSIFSLLSFWPVLLAWGLPLLALLFYNLPNLRLWPSARPALKVKGADLIFLAGICFYVAAIAVIAAQAPANNWDAMSYHMTRVANWAQNKSVNFYATHDLRQLNYPPLSEYYILNFQVLSQGDRWANLVQTFSMIASLLCVSLLAKYFGATLRGQIMAVAIAVTLPIGILEGSSAQNDHVACFWVLAAIYFLLRHKDTLSPTHLLCAGASLGMGLLAKGAAYIYMAPFLLSYALIPLRPFAGRSLKNAMAILLVALSINSAHYLKNYQLCQSPLSCEELVDLTFNEEMSAPLLASNVIRSAAMNLAMPFQTANRLLIWAVEGAHKFLGISANDTRTTYALESFKIGSHIFHEDYASNPLHTALFIFLLPLAFVMPLPRQLKIFALNALFAALLLNLLLKWNPWLVRFYLTPSILLSIPLGLVLSTFRNHRAANILIAICLIGSSWWLLNNQTKPLLGHKNIFNTSRQEQYFSARPTHLASYAQTAQAIKESHCQHIGLRMNPFAWQYPLWAYLDPLSPSIRLEAVDVINRSEIYADAGFMPCLIVDNLPHDKEIIAVGNKRYVRVERFEFMKIYAPLR